MAILTSLKFNDHSGVIAVDAESWHLRRRKSYFSNRIYTLSPSADTGEPGVELLYAGVGYPAFHFETAERASKALADKKPGDIETVYDAARVVLDAFTETRRRRVNDRMKFLYGMDIDDMKRMDAGSGGGSRARIGRHALQLAGGGERPGYPPLSFSNDACLIGIDAADGYSAFALKEKDCVLSYQSCGFEAMGHGRYGAAASFAKLLNGLFLDHRRQGVGFRKGFLTVLDAMVEAFEHYGQAGGPVSLGFADAEGAPGKDRVRVIEDNRSHLAIDIARLFRNGLIREETAVALLEKVVAPGADAGAVEKEMFDSADDFTAAEKLLRGYKIAEPGLPAAPGMEDILE